MKRIVLALALLATAALGATAFAGQVPNPQNAPASTASGDLQTESANPQAPADSGLNVASEPQGEVLAGPCSGAGAVTFRAICAADLPSGTGTVASVGLSLPTIFSVSGSPVTGSGTLSATLASESANWVFAGPSSGSAAAPSFRALVAADLPTITSLGTVTAGAWDASVIGAAYGGSGVASPAAHAVLVGEGSSAFDSVALASGKLLIGQASGDPAAEAISGDVSITAAGVTEVSTFGGGTAFSTLAPKASPTFSGTVTGPDGGAWTSAGLGLGTAASEGAGTVDAYSFWLSGAEVIAPEETGNTVLAGPAALPNGNPSFRALVAADLPTITSLGTVTAGAWDASVIGAAYGGSGVASPTAHGVLLGEGSSAFTPVTLASGKLLIGQSSGDPGAEALSGDCTLTAAGAITCVDTNGTAFGYFATGTSAADLTGTLASARVSGSYTGLTGVGTLTAGAWDASVIGAAYGGSGVASPTAHGVLLGEGTSAFTPVTLASGKLLIGQASGDPAAEAISGDVSITAAGVTEVSTFGGGTAFSTLAPKASPTFSGTVTGPDGGAWTSAGLGLGTAAPEGAGTVDAYSFWLSGAEVIAPEEPGNTFLAGPAALPNGNPAFRALVAADLPTITSLGTVTVGTWDATAVGAAYGGSGVASPAAHGLMVGEGGAAMNSVVCSTAGAAFIGQGATADPVCQAPVTYTAAPSGPTAPASTSALTMMGLGASSITPEARGIVQIWFRADVVDTGSGATTAAGTGIKYEIKIGSGAAPGNGAAVTGSNCGNAVPEAMLSSVAAATGDVSIPTSGVCEITGLTVGTAYWIDVAAEAVGTASAMTFANVQVIATEVK